MAGGGGDTGEQVRQGRVHSWPGTQKWHIQHASQHTAWNALQGHFLLEREHLEPRAAVREARLSNVKV